VRYAGTRAHALFPSPQQRQSAQTYPLAPRERVRVRETSLCPDPPPGSDVCDLRFRVCTRPGDLRFRLPPHPSPLPHAGEGTVWVEFPGSETQKGPSTHGQGREAFQNLRATTLIRRHLTASTSKSTWRSPCGHPKTTIEYREAAYSDSVTGVSREPLLVPRGTFVVPAQR
jgi:hypothetical protein